MTVSDAVMHETGESAPQIWERARPDRNEAPIMRLTLRTLLAYLDDTLEPEQAKLIGQKVTESAVAQELIDRIKKVTRRRSLASPPVQGDTSRLDPNRVAEYLDSTLSADDLSQVEQTCLDDDVYLAEVAACHQILTLMLSEPARVPPPARQRIYRLVKGPESIPYRRPPDYFASADRVEPPKEDSAMRPDRLLTYVAAIVGLALGLAIALWLAWPTSQPSRKSLDEVAIVPAPVGVVTPPTAAAQPSNPAPAEAPKDDGKKLPPMPEPEPPAAVNNDDGPPKKPIDRVPIVEVNAERAEIGQLVTAGGLLVSQRTPADPWLPIRPKSRVVTADRLMALPGYRSEVRFDCGVQVMLWGSLLEFLMFVPPLLECEAIAHLPPAGIDADLTLDRGRITIANVKPDGPAHVRLRFRDEVWDLTLAQKSEVIIDGLISHPPGARFNRQTGGDNPLTQLFLGVLKGTCSITVRDMAPIDLSAPPGLAVLGWDNKGRLKQPLKLTGPLAQWTTDIPTRGPAVEYKRVMDKLYDRLAQPKASVETALLELTQDAKPHAQAYAGYALPAIDVIAPVVDAMDDLLKPNMRAAGVVSLYQWVARQPENALELRKLLVDKKDYSDAQADASVQMAMLSLGQADIYAVATYEFLFDQLNDPKLAIREFAYWHLGQLDPDGMKSSLYNPILTDGRDTAIARWRKRLTDGKIPPKPPKQNGPTEKTPAKSNGPAEKAPADKTAPPKPSGPTDKGSPPGR